MATHSMTFQEIELGRWELSFLDPSRTFWSARSDQPVLYWTPFEELGVVVLNAFSPRGTIFWNISEYSAFRLGSHAYSNRFIRRDSVRDTLDELTTELAGTRKSVFSEVLLRGLTSGFGDRYESNVLGADYFLLSKRHVSVAVPTARKGLVCRYFQRQAQEFLDDATREYPEHLTAVYLGGESDPDESMVALTTSVVRMTDPKRRQLASLISTGTHAILSEQYRTPQHLDILHKTRCVSIRLDYSRLDKEFVNELRTIAHFRVDYALKHCTLEVVESLKNDLSTPGWFEMPLADLQEELLGEINQRLARYPIIQIDPFAHIPEPYEPLIRETATLAPQ